MIAALLLFLAVQGEDAPLAQDRERIRSKAPLTAAEKSEYAAPAGAALQPRAPYAFSVHPVAFIDQSLENPAAPKQLIDGLLAYYARASSGRFALTGALGATVALEQTREKFERKALARAASIGEGVDGLVFVVPGGLPARGTPLWPHRGVLRIGERDVDYILVPEQSAPGIPAHEFMHLLGFADKYDDEKAQVGSACILGTGYSVKNPPPPCAECREKLGWASAGIVDPSKASSVVLEPDLSKLVRIPMTPEGDEALLLEMRERLLVWHIGGGKKIELVGRFPSGAGDRLTPYSEPAFRGRALGARPVWLTDLRVEDGKAWVRVGPDAPLTPLEDWRRTHVGKRLGD